MEIPGYMSRGNWTAGLFIDKRASIYAVKALTRIFTGKAGGTTSLLSILVGKFLGVEQVPITYETRDKTRIFQIPKIIDGAVTPIRRQGPRARHGDPAIRNTGSRRKSSSPSRTRAACAHSAATGTSPAARPRSASWIGADREAQEAGHLAAGARIFRPSAHRIRLVPGLPLARRGERGALDGDVLVAGPGAFRRRHRRADRAQAARSRKSCRPGRANCSTTSSTT